MLYIQETVRQLFIADALRAYPNECCGFLFGAEKREERVIDDILIVSNVKEGDKRRRFAIAPQDYIKAEQYAEEKQLCLLGIYHSHPDHPSVPSEHDRLAAQPFFSYVIISVRENAFVSLQSWRLNDNFQFEEEKLIKTYPDIFTHTIYS